MKDSKRIYKESIKNSLESYKESYREYIYRKCKDYKYICIWGVGNMGRKPKLILDELGLNLSFYCDNNPAKTGRVDPYGYGIQCISPEKLLKYKDDTIILIPTRYYKEIFDQLIKMGFGNIERFLHTKISFHDYIDCHDRIEIIKNLMHSIDLMEDVESCRVISRIIEEWVRNEYKYGAYDDIYTSPQYFPSDIIKPRNSEVFIDCGAYIGDIVDDFLLFEGGIFDTYYGFELNSDFYEILKKKVKTKWGKTNGKFIIENKGISETTKKLRYSSLGEASKIDDNGNEIADVVSIDEYLNGNRATFIKMDIEGAEIPALRGAEKTIKKWHPKLAICIYHNPYDYWEIPALIKEMVPEYHIFVRHHTDLTTETVCYAATDEDTV